MESKKTYNLRSNPKLSIRALEANEDTNTTVTVHTAGTALTVDDPDHDLLNAGVNDLLATPTASSTDTPSSRHTCDTPPDPPATMATLEDGNSIHTVYTSDSEKSDNTTLEVTTPVHQDQIILQTMLSNIMKEIKQTNQEMRESKQELNLNMSQLSDNLSQLLKSEIKQSNLGLNQKIDQKFESLNQKINAIQTHTNEKMDQMHSELVQLNHATELKCQHEILNLKEEIFDLQTEQRNTIERKLEEKMEKLSIGMRTGLNEQTGEILNTTKDLINEQNYEIKEIKTNLSKHEEDIKHLLNNDPKGKPLYMPTEIQVTCLGNSAHAIETNPPKFTGRGNNPIQFLRRLERFYERMRTRQSGNPIELLHDTIENCLDQHAARWWQICKDNIESWEGFERLFMEKYWNREVQRGIRHKLEIEKYKPGGTLNRSEYFIERVITLRSMEPRPAEMDIIAILTNHFEEIIQDACRVQNVTNVHDMELLLQREDLKDHHRNSQNRSQNSNHTTHNDQKNKFRFHNQTQSPPRHYQPYGHDNTNPRAYHHPNNNGYMNKSHYPNQNTRYEPYQNRPHNYNHNQPRNGNGYHPQNQHRNNYQLQQNDPRQPNKYPSKEQAQICQLITTQPTPPKLPTPTNQNHNTTQPAEN